MPAGRPALRQTEDQATMRKYLGNLLNGKQWLVRFISLLKNQDTVSF